MHFIVSYDIFCYLMVLNGIVWYLMLSYGIQLNCTILHAIALLDSRGLCLASSVQRSEEFHSGTGRDGIQVQSRDPGIFRDGISLIFSSRDFLEIVRDFSGLTFF